jgi:hypothetical protein
MLRQIKRVVRFWREYISDQSIESVGNKELAVTSNGANNLTLMPLPSKLTKLEKLPSGSNQTFEFRLGLPSDLPNVVVGLPVAITRLVAETNDDRKPFALLAEPNKSIAAVSLGYQALDSVH